MQHINDAEHRYGCFNRAPYLDTCTSSHGDTWQMGLDLFGQLSGHAPMVKKAIVHHALAAW